MVGGEPREPGKLLGPRFARDPPRPGAIQGDAGGVRGFDSDPSLCQIEPTPTGLPPPRVTWRRLRRLSYVSPRALGRLAPPWGFGSFGPLDRWGTDDEKGS